MPDGDLDKPLARDITVILRRIKASRPRVQCLTNTVAQNLTANVLLAIGADVSMATHPAEVRAMCGSAQALLINLGTLDAAREAAILELIAAPIRSAIPIVVDPVFAHQSPLRMSLARQLLGLDGVIIKGNSAEMAALAPFIPQGLTRITTGATDLIQGPAGKAEVQAGHPLMARATAMGCAAGAVIAAFAAVEPDQVNAAAAALTLFGRAGEEAAALSSGPGSFVVHLIDVLARIADSAATTEA